MTVVATAGHVDHGKSTLVRALTGTDPDRWAEEKARGLTIDLGFAATTLPSGRTLSFVDVPGHVRFLPNMLAGVGAVGAVLFVVAATEGWKPQSEEHLRILEVLGVDHGVVALTKVGGLDDDDRAIARLLLDDHLAGGPLATAEVVEVDVPGGVGVDDLRDALDRLLAATPPALDRGRARLWVDRSFAAKGSGTVVTGTLGGGGLRVGDEVALVPSGRRARVRGLQEHGHAVESIGPGHRVAVNLAGVDHGEVQRGHAVVAPGAWFATRRLDASLTVLPALDHAVSRRGAWVVHVGSAELTGRLRVLGPDALDPGATGAVRLHLPAEVPLLPGDRYVLREWGRGETVGGGEVLDVDPVVPASRARPSRSVERVVAERRWVTAADLALRTGIDMAPTIGSWVVDPSALHLELERITSAVDGAGPNGLDVAELGERGRLVLEAGLVDGVALDNGRARRSAAPATGEHPWLAALEAAPFTPPPPDDVDGPTRRDLLRRGLVVERDGTWFAASAVERAAHVVADLLAATPDGVPVSAIRDALGSSRKHVIPLVLVLDATGVTRRRGDLRIAGPRLPRTGGSEG